MLPKIKEKLSKAELSNGSCYAILLEMMKWKNNKENISEKVKPNVLENVLCQEWEIERKIAFLIAVVLSTSSGVSVCWRERIGDEVESHSVGEKVGQTWPAEPWLRLRNKRVGHRIHRQWTSWRCVPSCSASDWERAVRASLRRRLRQSFLLGTEDGRAQDSHHLQRRSRALRSMTIDRFLIQVQNFTTFAFFGFT